MTPTRIFCLFYLFSMPLWACDFANVSFVADYPTGKLDSCKQLDNNHYLLSSKPENRPINNSPWYAFKVLGKTSEPLLLSLEFDGNAPRYLPKISRDGVHWQSIPFRIHDKRLSFGLRPDSAGQLWWVAGQERIDNQAYQGWISNWQNKADLQVVTLGKSVEGRPIQAVISRHANVNEWLLLVGRQHPPEITGALAMQPFVDTLLADNALARDFRQRFNLLIVPNLNPDGVANGNWRHNANGLDLNRDWKAFSQPETRLVRDKLNALLAEKNSKGKAGKLVFALDFHSTQQDIFYTMPVDYGLAPATFVNDWLADVKAATRSTFVVRPKPGHNSNRGIFKQYIADTYGVHAVTYEMGDNTNRLLIPYIADVSANLLMQRLINTPAKAFYASGKAKAK